jgi:hypothetical protein
MLHRKKFYDIGQFQILIKQQTSFPASKYNICNVRHNLKKLDQAKKVNLERARLALLTFYGRSILSASL